MSDILIAYNKKEYSFPKYTTYYDMSKFFGCDKDSLGVIVDNRITSLTDRADSNHSIKFLNINTIDGNRIYQAGLKFVFEYAVKKTFSNVKVKFSYSLPYSIVAQLDGNKNLSYDDVSMIKKNMSNIVTSDKRIEKLIIKSADGMKYYLDNKEFVKADNVQNISDRTVVLYRVDDFVNYYYSEMPYSTGYINKYELKSLGKNLIAINFPTKNDNNTIRDFVNYRNVIDAYEQGNDWLNIMHVPYINDINKLVTQGKIANFVKSSELNFNIGINETAQKIVNSNIKCVMISGPSSSGKTTVTKRLGNYFEIYGLKPIIISLDDYYKERVDTPKDENGKYDFECLQALDIEYLNSDIKKLFSGESVTLPRFNFKTGCKESSNRVIKLEKNSIILFEGLHAINDELMPSIPNDIKYKIYVSPFIPLCVDEHNYISCSDLRLLRRIVRDFRTRGYDVSSTICNSESVRNGEDKYIFPYIHQADKIINTSLSYEVGVLKVYVAPLLASVSMETEYYNEARRLLSFLKQFFTISSEFVPADSILREFIGGEIDD